MKSNVLNSEKRLYAMIRARMNRLVLVIVLCLLIAPMVVSGAAGKVKHSAGPTAENALAADEELARVLQANDTVGIYRMLDKDWAVIPSNGGVYEGPSVFPSGIRSGSRTLKKMSLSEPRVHLYGNIALVTTKVELISINHNGEAWSGQLRQTDVWRWENGGWKCLLTQEALIPK